MLTAGWVSFRWAPACEKLPKRATVWSVRRWSSCISMRAESFPDAADQDN
jgi:hypothetical protein